MTERVYLVRRKSDGNEYYSRIASDFVFTRYADELGECEVVQVYEKVKPGEGEGAYLLVAEGKETNAKEVSGALFAFGVTGSYEEARYCAHSVMTKAAGEYGWNLCAAKVFREVVTLNDENCCQSCGKAQGFDFVRHCKRSEDVTEAFLCVSCFEIFSAADAATAEWVGDDFSIVAVQQYHAAV